MFASNGGRLIIILEVHVFERMTQVAITAPHSIPTPAFDCIYAADVTAARSFVFVLVALVETRTYIAMFIAVLLSEQRAGGLVFQARLTPLNKRLIAAIPSRASIRLFYVAVPNVPLSFFRRSPDEEGILGHFPQQKIVLLLCLVGEHFEAKATRRAAVVLSGSCRICHL